MPDTPLVSIAAINYNNSKYVIETLESIRSQTYPNIELIIVDDCSTDNDVELINNWLVGYSGKYKFIQHEANRGVCATYNTALDNATGKYFSAIDTDDIMLPEKTATQVAILEASVTKVAGVYSDAYVVDVNGSPQGMFIQKYKQFSEVPRGNIYETLLEGNYIPCMSVMLKRTVFEDIGVYDEQLIYEDYDMWLRIARKYELVFSDFASAKYRIRPGSLTFTIKNWTYSDIKIFLKHIGAPLPMPRLRNLAQEAYTTDDKETMPLIKELAYRTNNRYFWTTYFCWEYKISPEISELILKEDGNEDIEPFLSAELEKGDQDTINVFIGQICSPLSLEILKGIARDTYYNNAEGRIPLIKALASKANNRYFSTAYLLCHFRIPTVFGDKILAKEDGNIDIGSRPGIKEGDTSGIITFVERYWSLIPLESLKTIACDVYCNEIEGRMILIKELAKKTNNKYFRTAYLLCEFGIPPVFGEKVLANKKDYISSGFSTDMKKGDYPDMMVFAGQVCAVLSEERVKEIANYAYYNNFIDAKPFIEALVQKTKSRYIKAVSLLWKSKVVVVDGKAILAEIEKSGTDKGNLLTDLKLHRDISRAKKTS